jgi:hypothetical protein
MGVCPNLWIVGMLSCLLQRKAASGMTRSRFYVDIICQRLGQSGAGFAVLHLA